MPRALRTRFRNWSVHNTLELSPVSPFAMQPGVVAEASSKVIFVQQDGPKDSRYEEENYEADSWSDNTPPRGPGFLGIHFLTKKWLFGVGSLVACGIVVIAVLAATGKLSSSKYARHIA